MVYIIAEISRAVYIDLNTVTTRFFLFFRAAVPLDSLLLERGFVAHLQQQLKKTGITGIAQIYRIAWLGNILFVLLLNWKRKKKAPCTCTLQLLSVDQSAGINKWICGIGYRGISL